MKSNQLHIIVSILAATPQAIHQSKTGGAVRLVQILSNMQKTPNTIIHILAPQWIIQQFKKDHIKATYIEIKSNIKWKTMFTFIFESFILCFKSWKIIRNIHFLEKHPNIILYVSSDLFWEVFPAYIWKLHFKTSKWVQIIHHIYPSWYQRPGNKIQNFLGYCFQRISLGIIKIKADKIIVLNQSLKKKLGEWGFSDKKIALSSNAINATTINNAPKNKQIYDGVYFGRLSYSKGIIDLIHIWKKVCTTYKYFNLAIIGGVDPFIKKNIISEINKQKINNNVKMFGFLNEKKAFSLIKSSKIFLFPSHEEGWGIAIAEAMACKLPVVAWNLPVYKEVFEKHIIQIKEYDIEAFAQTVLQLLNNPKKRQQAGESGYRFIQKYSWDNVFEKEFKIIQSLVEE